MNRHKNFFAFNGHMRRHDASILFIMAKTYFGQNVCIFLDKGRIMFTTTVVTAA